LRLSGCHSTNPAITNPTIARPVGSAGRVHVGGIGSGDRPGGDVQGPPHHDVDPDQQPDDHREGAVDGIARRLAHQPGSDDLEDLQPDGAEQRAARRAVPVGAPGQSPEQVQEDGGIHREGEQEGQGCGNRPGRRAAGQPDPVERVAGGRRREARHHK